MSRALNKVQLIGHVGKDPEYTFTSGAPLLQHLDWQHRNHGKIKMGHCRKARIGIQLSYGTHNTEILRTSYIKWCIRGPEFMSKEN